MGGEIVLFAHHRLARFAFGNFQSGDRGEHFLLAPMPQLVAKGFGPPRSGGFIIPVEGAPQTPQVFTGMIEVEQLGRALPSVLRHIPDPGGAIADHQPRSGATQPSAQSLPVQPPAKLHRIALPADDELACNDPATTRTARGFFLRVIHAGLPFVPCHTVFLGFPPAPTRPALARSEEHTSE